MNTDDFIIHRAKQAKKTEEKFLRTLDAISRREAKAMNPQLHHTLKSSYLSSLEYDLMQMRRKLNALHVIEKNASVPELKELEEMNKMHLDFLSTVQRLRTETENEEHPHEH